MLDVRYSTKFKKDFKACVKRRYNMELLQQIIDTLRIPDTLPPKNVDHNLCKVSFSVPLFWLLAVDAR